MGTRNLTAVVMDGEYKIAQYGQWDGYPEGQGLVALDFLKNHDLSKFRKILNDVKFLDVENMTEKEIQHINDNFKTDYNHLSREHGAGILKLVFDGARELKNDISFAKDSLFCEWAYVIDLDSNKFEVYTGFNKGNLLVGRFASEDSNSDSEYGPVVLAKAYDLNNLPDDDDFVNDFKSDD